MKNAPATPELRKSTKSLAGEIKTTVDPKKNTQSVRVAVIGPKTGLQPGVPPLIHDVARFAAKRINQKGGLLGRPIELIEFDNTNSSLGSQQEALEAVSQNISAAIGGWYSSNAIAMAKVMQNARIPMIAVAASNPKVTQIGDYIFRAHCVDTFQGSAMAEYAYHSLKARKAAILVNIGNAYSPYLGDVFFEQFQQFGGEVLFKGEFIDDSGNWASLIRPLLKHKPDIIYLPAYERESAEIIKKARQKGVLATFLGADGWVPDMITYGGELLKGGLYTKGWHHEANQIMGLHEEYSEWVSENGPVKRDIIPLTIDSCFILFSAIETAGSSDPSKIRDALSGIKGFKGLTGTYTFNANGDPLKPLHILKLTGKKSELVKTILPKEIRLGVILAKTGDAFSTNIIGFEAARFAVDEINRRGGVLGHYICLLEYDNKSTALGSREAAKAAVEDRVAAVIGASWSSHSSAMAPILQKAGIPMISPASTNPKVTQHGDYIFRACFTDKLQGQVMAEFAMDSLKAKTAMIMTNTESDYSVDLAKYFKGHFQKDGHVLGELNYLQDTNDFTPMLDIVKQKSPDVVFIPGYHRDAAFILKQAHQMDISTIFLGGDGWDDVMYELAPEAIDGHYFAEHWHIDMPEDDSRKFVEKYSHKHNNFRTGMVALTYDTVYLVCDAIKRAKSIDPRHIRDALSKTIDFNGVTGKITYNRQGDPVKPVVILRFKNGSAEFHKTVSPKT